ncbi:MAG: RNA methyltransferase [Ruminococcaceae bacterium]|nr:RNA methyltransferase [Oscillospiraceae bacterium]
MNSQIFNVDCITSRANSTIVKIAKLTNKKSRKEEQLFTLDGVKLFLEAYGFNAKIKCIILNDESVFEEDLIIKLKDLQSRNIQILCVSEHVFLKLTEENAPQGIITVCGFLENHNFSNIIEDVGADEKIMAFEAVRDPGNIGTILRNAAAFGIDRVIFSSDCADIYSQKVIRASMGAIFKLKITVSSDLCCTLEELKNKSRRIIATTLRENSLQLRKDKIIGTDVFVIGNEGQGVSEHLMAISNETLFIPMCTNTESLNAAIATAILMWELYNL